MNSLLCNGVMKIKWDKLNMIYVQFTTLPDKCTPKLSLAIGLDNAAINDIDRISPVSFGSVLGNPY